MGIPRKRGTITLAGMTVLVITVSLCLSIGSVSAEGNSWGLMESGTTGELESVWGTSASDVFAVGRDGLILHYDGSMWTSISSGTDNWLRDIWGISSSDVFAIGSGAILHYDGNTWSTMDGGTEYSLRSIWGASASDVFAVGRNGVILRYDGSTWTRMSSDLDCWLHGIWGSSSNNVFAVGGGEGGGVILHYDGTIWSSMESGHVLEAKYRRHRDLKLDLTVFAAGNTDRAIPPELLSRFDTKLYFPSYSFEDFVSVCEAYLTRYEDVPRDVAKYIGRQTWQRLDKDVRTARGIARRLREKTTKDVDRIVRFLGKYGKPPHM